MAKSAWDIWSQPITAQSGEEDIDEQSDAWKAWSTPEGAEEPSTFQKAKDYLSEKTKDVELPSAADVVQYGPSKAWGTAKNVMALGQGDISPLVPPEQPTNNLGNWYKLGKGLLKGQKTDDIMAEMGPPKAAKPLVPVTEYIEKASQPLPGMPTEEVPMRDKIGKSLLKGLGGVGESLTTPEGLTGLGTAVATGTGAGYIPDIATGAWESGVGAARDLWNKRYPEAAEKAGTAAGLAVGLPILKKLGGVDALKGKDIPPPPPDAGPPPPPPRGRFPQEVKVEEPVKINPEELAAREAAFDERMAPKEPPKPVEEKGVTLYDEKGEAVLVKDGKMYKEFKPQEPTIEEPVVPTPRVNVPRPAPKTVIDVYHGTDKDFKDYKPNTNYEAGVIDPLIGTHFSATPDIANKFADKVGGNVRKTKLDISKEYELPQQKYESGVLQSDQTAIQSDVAAKVFPRRPDLFIEWAKGLGLDKSSELLPLPQLYQKLKAENGFRQFADNNGLLAYGDLSRKLVSEYVNAMKADGFEVIKYQNTAPMETEGVQNRTSYIKLNDLAPEPVKTTEPLVKEVVPPPQKARQNVGGIRTTGAFTQPEPFTGKIGDVTGPEASAKGYVKTLLKKNPQNEAIKLKGAELLKKSKEAAQQQYADTQAKRIEDLDAQRLATFSKPKVVNPKPTLYDATGKEIGPEEVIQSVEVEKAPTTQPEYKPLLKPMGETVTPATAKAGVSAFGDINKVPHPLSGYPGNKATMLRAGAYDGVIDPNLPYSKVVEPFGGSGLLGNAITRGKEIPRVLNDLDPDVVNYHRTVKDNPKALIDKLNEYSDEIDAVRDAYPEGGREAHRIVSDWWKSKEAMLSDPQASPIDKAAFFQFKNSVGSGQGLVSGEKVGFGWNLKKNTVASRITEIKLHNKALQNVEITNLDAAELLNKAKSGELVLLDPPYAQFAGKETKILDYKAGKDLATMEGAVRFIKEDMADAVKRGVDVVYTNNADPAIIEALQSIGLNTRKAIVRSQNKGGQGGTREEVIGWSRPVSTPVNRGGESAGGGVRGPTVKIGGGLLNKTSEGPTAGTVGKTETLPPSSGVKGTPTKEAIEKAPIDVKINAKETPYTIVDRNGIPIKSVKTADQIVSAIDGTAPAPKIGSTLLKSRPNDLKATIDPDFDGEPLKIETRPLKSGQTIIYDATTRARTNIVGDSPREAMDKAKIVFKNSDFKETYTPRTAQRVELKAIEKGLEKSFDDMPERDKVHIADQAELAYKLIKNDWEFARRAINGQEKVPGRLRPESLWNAMYTIAENSKDVDLMKQLAKSPIVTETISEAGTTLSMMQRIDKDSATYKMMEIAKAREEVVKQKYGKDIKKAEAEIEAEIDRFVKRNSPSKGDWAAFVDSIKCK